MGDALASLPDCAPCLLVVDQLEEVWSAGSASTAAAFLDGVVELLDRGAWPGSSPSSAATTCTGSPSIPGSPRAGSGVVLATPLTAEELRRVVEQPAAGVGLAVDPEVVIDPDLAQRGRTCCEPLVSTHPDTQGSGSEAPGGFKWPLTNPVSPTGSLALSEVGYGSVTTTSCTPP